jgi:hypothetical protein
MRSFIVVLCLVAATTVLQGCGGGGTSTPGPAPKLECVNSQIDVVSQSRTSTSKTTSVSTTATITGKEVIDGTSTSKLDVDKMNLYENSVSTVTLTVSGDSPIPMPSIDIKNEEKIIVNVAKKVITVWIKMTNVTSGKVLLTNCSAVTIDAMPPAELVSMIFKGTVVPKLQEVATCSSNDGKYDHFDMNISFQSPTMPGLKTVTDVDVQGSETIFMDKDLVMHSAKGNLKLKATYEAQGLKVPVTVDESTEATASQAALGGPEPADLDYSSWGTCTPIHIPKGGDVTTLFQPTKLSEITKRFNNNALFKNQLLVAIQAAIKTTEAKKFIV